MIGVRFGCGEPTAEQQGDQREDSEDRQRGAQGVEAGLGVLVDDRRGGGP
jgi:hypothetical protein